MGCFDFGHVIVRRAVSGDVDAIRDIDNHATRTLRKTYRPNERASQSRQRLARKTPPLVALWDGRIVGIVQYCLEGSALRVIGLGVHDDFRRRGVARALIESLVDIARQEGKRRLHLHTVKQTGNVAVFERLRFQVIAEREDTFAKSDVFTPLTDVELERPVL